MGIFSEIFVWWGGQTLSTRIFTARRGDLVGEDKDGNRYYQERAIAKGRKQKRRWVIYLEDADASRVPPDWHGWLHYTFEEPPTLAPFKLKSWEKDHVPNLTGTPEAYRPSGSLYEGGERKPASGDYEAWKPNG
jgi:NADH:ubiquinone oxidoreductase subunit